MNILILRIRIRIRIRLIGLDMNKLYKKISDLRPDPTGGLYRKFWKWK